MAPHRAHSAGRGTVTMRRSRHSKKLSISVVIPAYRAEATIRTSINSALGQTRAPEEVMVVLDGAAPVLERSLDSHYGSAIKILNTHNGGDCRARNLGIAAAGGDWIAHLDADDIWMANKLERQIELIERAEGLSIVHSGYSIFGLSDGQAEDRTPAHESMMDFVPMLMRRTVKLSTALVRRDIGISLPAWARLAGDIIFFAECARMGKHFGYDPTPLVAARQHHGQLTRQHGTVLFEHFENRLHWLELVRPLVERSDYFQALGGLIEQMYWLARQASEAGQAAEARRALKRANDLTKDACRARIDQLLSTAPGAKEASQARDQQSVLR